MMKQAAADLVYFFHSRAKRLIVLEDRVQGSVSTWGWRVQALSSVTCDMASSYGKNSLLSPTAPTTPQLHAFYTTTTTTRRRTVSRFRIPSHPDRYTVHCRVVNSCLCPAGVSIVRPSCPSRRGGSSDRESSSPPRATKLLPSPPTTYVIMRQGPICFDSRSMAIYTLSHHSSTRSNP